jgi:hypothetical protein
MDSGSLEYNVIVVKWGNKFTPEHVNRLYRMAKRNITLPFNFYCYTEDPIGIYKEVKIVTLDETLKLEKWWWKLTLFKPNNLGKNINLFLDLDVIIQKNIDHLFSKARPDKISLICYNEDWTDRIYDNADVLTLPGYNSSIMVWYNNHNSYIYEKFIKNVDHYQKFYLGIDRFFTYEISQNSFIDIGEKEYYHRIILDQTKNLESSQSHSILIPKLDCNGKKIGTRSIRAFFDPEKPICVFNGCHEDVFYKGMEKYFFKSDFI